MYEILFISQQLQIGWQVTVQIFEVISDKFSMVRICT